MGFHGYHHITSIVTSARDDVAFHTGLLGLRNVKRTVLLDGKRPFYHLYYGNEYGEPGTLLTSFAFGPDRPEGRRGSGQVSSISLSVPKGSLDFWEDRLSSRGVQATRFDRLGERRLLFSHPDGIEHQLVEVTVDRRLPWTGADVPEAAAIRGVHSVTVCTREVDELDMFLHEGMGLKSRDTDGAVTSYTMADGSAGQLVEVDHQPDTAQGTWGYMRNTVDHVAFDVRESEAQLEFKDRLEAMGYIDVTEPRDRNYFYSVYFRTPAGAMFEATRSHPQGFLKDETLDSLGSCLQLPRWLEEHQDELLAELQRTQPLD
ncbi:hydroquinone meta cleavage dioxygenase [Streptomyces hygroscopicus subsp. jinggangensis 5008]|nr:hydroquinone meta cleavage dioxygenase [Streptomyces hygroscopicus subsp. jinggangensis 5008]